eukprot:12425674-Karenia_brevis.AAC.3
MLDMVFKNAVLRVALDAPPEPDTHVASFIDKLREVPSLFFAPLPEHLGSSGHGTCHGGSPPPVGGA